MANLLAQTLSKITSFITSASRRAYTSAIMFGTWVRELWPDINSRDSVEKSYADNTAVYSIVNRHSTKFGSIPRYVYDAKSKRNDEYTQRVSDGPQVQQLLTLLDNPNPYMTQGEFLELVALFYDTTGEAIVWLNRGDIAQKYVPPILDSSGTIIQEATFVNRTDIEMDMQPVLEMYLLAPGFVGIIPDTNNIFGIAGYWLEINGIKFMIRKGDIIHWKRQNPVFDPVNGAHLHGLNPLRVGRRTVQENKDATDSIDRMFKNDGAKGVMINENLNWHQLEEKQRQQYTEMIDGRLNNHVMKGAIATMGGKWRYENIAKDTVDAALLEGKKFTWQELCFLLQVPYTLFDPKTTFNNQLEAQKGWVSNTILPQCRIFDQKLTERLTKAFGLFGKVVIWSDCSSLPEFQKDIAALITSMNLAWYISPNKKLTTLGYEPEDNDLFNEPWIPQGYTPLSEVNNEINFQQTSSDLNPPPNDAAKY